MKIIKWTARILSLCILIFALPFYFGYGNPLPSINSNYSLWENVTLTMIPLIFLGLVLGWRYTKLGGWLVTIAVIVVFIVGFLTEANLSINLVVPLIPGILFLINGYIKSN